MLRGRALGGSQAESGCHLAAQVRIDVSQYGQCALLDLLFVDLAELEGEGLDDMGLLNWGETSVEECSL